MAKSPLIPTNGSDLVQFSFGADFQMKLQKVLMLEDAGDVVMEYLKPNYFESPEMRWIFSEMQRYFKDHHTMPSWMVLKHRAKTAADPKIKPTLLQTLEYQEQLTVKEEVWVRSQILEWIQQNIFHTAFKETKALWDSGKRQEAIDHMAKQQDVIKEAVWKDTDRGWFFEELPAREAKRQQNQLTSKSIVTGISDLDKVLDGGLNPGEMGIWMAYAKCGKSSLLMNHGTVACRAQFKKVLHIVLEGSRELIEARYDACFAEEYYSTLKHGGMDSVKYKQLWTEYQYLKKKLVVRGFTKEWNYSALHIDAEIKDLKKHFGWTPDLIIVDYGDLVHGRNGPYAAPWMSERDAFRDLKSISNQGFALWTASQAQRPDKNYAEKEHILKTSQIAGGIEKVRVADFVGSINATLEEKKQGVARLYAELYRDNEADKLCYIHTDLAKMKMGGSIEPPDAAVGPGLKPKAANLGYK